MAIPSSAALCSLGFCDITFFEFSLTSLVISFQSPLSVTSLYVLVCMLVSPSYPTFSHPMDCSPQGSSVLVHVLVS